MVCIWLTSNDEILAAPKREEEKKINENNKMKEKIYKNCTLCMKDKNVDVEKNTKTPLKYRVMGS